MIAAAMRDLMAVFFYEGALGNLRDLHLREALEGFTPGPEYWPAGEREAFEEMRRRFFSADAHKYLGEPVEGGRSDANDFENRTQRLTEIALVMTHGILKSIPHVGHPDFRDD
jgi:hypothetical protein